MARLSDWITDSEKYEFCKSYGVENMPEAEFIERQDDFYISLLSRLNFRLNAYFESEDEESDAKIKAAMLELVKGILVYSQKETQNDFQGVRQRNNQLYVAAIYYLCDYTAVSSWAMGEISIDEYEETSAQLLSFIVTGGRSVKEKEIKDSYWPVFAGIDEFIRSGEEGALDQVVAAYNQKYDNRDFESPTDFFMINVLRCVLKKFKKNNIRQSLRKADSEFDWTAYSKHSYKQHILSFLPSQQDALDKGLLTFTGSFSLKMPTSAGKSYITELLIHYELQQHPDSRVLYLAPLRALSRELRDRFRKIHKRLGFTYATKYGGSAASIVEDGIDEAQLLIATPESFMSIESASQEKLDRFSLVICDEGQLLEDKSRGINYEMLLTRLRRRNKARFLFISAIIPNISVVNSWLKGTDNHIGDSTYRPSKQLLAEALVGDDAVDLYLENGGDGEPSHQVPSFITKANAQGESLRYYDENQDRWKLCNIPVGCTLALRSLKAGSVLLFTTGKTRGVSCIALAKCLMNMVDAEAFDAPIKYVINPEGLYFVKEYASYQLGDDHLFCQALERGFAYHHGDVPQDLREKIERAYDQGIIRLIISNTTLAEGVNLPIKTIVIAFAMDQSNPGMFLPNTRLKNIIGRVGRAGRERYGTIIVPVAYKNGWLMKTIREALNPDDSALKKMKGTLFTMVEDLVNRDIVSDHPDIDELLSIPSFADAIDEMIIRSSEDNVNEMDMDSLVSESLAYSLSDEDEKAVLRNVFSTRHQFLKETFEDERYQLSKATGLNLRELEVVEKFITDEIVEQAEDLLDVDDEVFVSTMVQAVLGLPTVQEEMASTKTKQRLLADSDRLKRLAIMWMQGKQYHEMAKKEKLSVDNVILIVMFLQSVVHDKAASILAYMSEVKGLETGTATFWPEYLQLGINDRLMYEAHKLKVPERIQIHAIKRFYADTDTNFGDYDFLEISLVENRERIWHYMQENGYPQMSITGLMEVIGFMERRD